MFHRRLPNPDLVLVPTLRPRGRYVRLTTRGINTRAYPVHEHEATIDRNGDGITDNVAGHFHRVRGGRVLPDEHDGHTHALTALPASVG